MIKLIATDIDGTLVKDSAPELYREIPETIKLYTLQKMARILYIRERTYRW